MIQDDKKALLGSAALLAIYAAVAVTCSVLPDSPKDQKKEEKEKTTIRQDASAMWHRVKCAVMFCDEDGRCPVWSSRDSRCYMLTRDEEKFMEIYEKTE
jgi:hypothetical protein